MYALVRASACKEAAVGRGWHLEKRRIKVILVVAAIVAGASIFGFHSLQGHKSYPNILTDNTVVNETIAGNLENFSTIPPNTHVFFYNATASFLYNNQSSNLTLRIVLDPYNNGVFHYIEVDPKIWAFGNITQGLHPGKFMLNMSDLGVYSNGDVEAFSHGVNYVSPYNATAPASPPAWGAAAYGNFSFSPQFTLINQTRAPGYYEFGVNWLTELNFHTPSSGNIGTHILHFTLSLEGLGQPVTAQINVLLVDAS